MRIARTFGPLAFALVVGGCWSDVYENPASQYVSRSDTITLGAGNAKDVNAATHVVDPWPRNVNNRRIPADGQRMVGAVQRYQRPQTARSPGQGQGTQAVGPTDTGGARASGASGSTFPAATPPY